MLESEPQMSQDREITPLVQFFPLIHTIYVNVFFHRQSLSGFNTADRPPPSELPDAADQHSKQISSIRFESSRLLRLLIGLFPKSLCPSASSASSSS